MSTTLTPIAKYIAKIERCGALPDAAREALIALPMRVRRFGVYQDIVREGDRTAECCFIDSGMVSRYRTLKSGARQILSFHVAGDMIDLQSALVVVADHGIRAHSPTTVFAIPHEHILRVAATHPAIGRAFWFDTLVDAAVFREWTVNVGRRNTRERTAHLLLEMEARLSAAGLLQDGWFELPISQSDLADALGITSVHMNRTMQWLRGEQLIRTHSRKVKIENRAAIIDLAGFDPIYLHPEGPRQVAA